MKREFIYIIVACVFAVLYFNSCSDNQRMKQNEKQNNKALNDTIKYFNNEIGLEVAEKLAFKGSEKELRNIIASKDNELKQLQVALKGFKKPSSATMVKTETKIDTVKIPFEVKIPCEFERTFAKVDQFYSIFGKVNQVGITFDNISIPNTQTIVTGQKKVGFFKTEYRIEVTNSNPYIKTTSADSYNFTERVKRFGVGPVIGYGLSGNGSSLFVGFGISYDLLKF